eukprot:2263648-Lingulodinium_polyedra.AAC.1
MKLERAFRARHTWRAFHVAGEGFAIPEEGVRLIIEFFEAQGTRVDRGDEPGRLFQDSRMVPAARRRHLLRRQAHRPPGGLAAPQARHEAGPAGLRRDAGGLQAG